MIEIVKDFLYKYNLFSGEKTLLVGFSGGYDSMCLLHVLWQLSKETDYELVALHLNHNWRDDESKKEEKNCKMFCKNIGVKFVSETLPDDVKKTETAAREARQKFFKKYYEQFNANALLLAHNKSDNTETVIYRAIKGTGVKGLAGIAEHNNIFGCEIYRPLLNCSRAQVETYCTKNFLQPNNDSSNRSLEYKRNFIRLKILPLMKEINPLLDDKIMNLSEICTSEQNIVNEYLELLSKEIKIDGKFVTEMFLPLSSDVKKKFIMNLLSEMNLEYDTKRIEEILSFIEENANSKTGKTLSLSDGLLLLACEKFIYSVAPEKKCSDEIEINSPGKYELGNYRLTIETYEGEKSVIFPGENELFAFVPSLDFPLTLRFRREGDRISPFGMNGSMKLKKFLINKNVPKPLRNGIILLCKEGEILWAPGWCLSEKLRCNELPEYILKLEKR